MLRLASAFAGPISRTCVFYVTLDIVADYLVIQAIIGRSKVDWQMKSRAAQATPATPPPTALLILRFLFPQKPVEVMLRCLRLITSHSFPTTTESGLQM